MAVRGKERPRMGEGEKCDVRDECNYSLQQKPIKGNVMTGARVLEGEW